jgi:hypothetical protein
MSSICLKRGKSLFQKKRARSALSNGSALEFIDGAGGDLIFRPVKTSPALDLLDHLKKLHGVEIPPSKHHDPPRA